VRSEAWIKRHQRPTWRESGQLMRAPLDRICRPSEDCPRSLLTVGGDSSRARVVSRMQGLNPAKNEAGTETGPLTATMPMRFVNMMGSHTLAAVAVSALVTAGCSVTTDGGNQEFNGNAAVDAWVAMWNSYDLDLVDELFLADSSVTYLSSEKEGVIAGIDAVREHHAGFGFSSGGSQPNARLWVENLHFSTPGTIAVVTGVWHFRRGDDATAELQRGPMTLVYVPTGDGYRIAHAHFANY
jgi:hypothetical protein